MRIAIIGAGPAGAAAAIRLASAGASVSLFDHSHPREKPCGGGVTGRALALVADVLDIASMSAVVVKSAIVESVWGSPEVELSNRGANPNSSLLVFSRAAFDAALVEAARKSGARFIPEKALSVTHRSDKVTVKTQAGEYLADFVIGADGTNSLVRKTFARPFIRSELSIAAGYYVHGPRKSHIVIRRSAEQPGYLWSFPRPDHLAVGVCAVATERASAGQLQAQSLAWIAAHDLERGSRLEPYAWPIPSIGFGSAATLRLAGTGWMLTGDAAGLVDPLTREGIYYALQSGQWAADALQDGRAHASERYARRVEAEMYPELNRAASLSGLFFSSDFWELFVTALQGSGPIREVFRDLVGGTQPYRGLERRLLSTQEWRLAGRAALMMVQSLRPR